jgi:hypothetical protein
MPNSPSGKAIANSPLNVSICEKKETEPTFIPLQMMEMIVDFEHGDSADPFITEDDFFPRFFNNPSEIRKRIVDHANRLQYNQFRTYLFTVGIFGKAARLFRWDRSGCQVTEPIDYSADEGNRQLTEFFLRFDRMADDPEARGWDMTVKEATVLEANQFTEAVTVARERGFRPQRARTRALGGLTGDKLIDSAFLKLINSVGDPTNRPRWKMSVLDGKAERDYIIGSHISPSDLPTGRATRGFVGMAVETKQLVFLKDSWLPDGYGIEGEHHWYDLLQQKKGNGLRKIGAYSHGSAVYVTRKLARCPDKKQQTASHLCAGEYGRVDLMQGYTHHRVVQPELYLPLETFRDSKHLTRVMHDAAIGQFL